MENDRKSCGQLLLLVGSNPLPNYITALLMNPESIRLFYTPETEPIKDRLCDLLKAQKPGVGIVETPIGDATSAEEVRRVFSHIPPRAHLNYTGGTKIMAAHARMAFGQSQESDKRSSYLDERDAVLRFDDGYTIDLSETSVQLSLEDVLKIHGIKTVSPGTADLGPLPTVEDAQTLARAVLEAPELAVKLYQVHRKEFAGGQWKPVKFSDAKNSPADVRELVGADLSVPQIPQMDWKKKTWERWRDFLGGLWLEIWCQERVKSLTPGARVHQGVNCSRENGRDFEIDLAVVRGHRLYVLSCTTEKEMPLCKSKLFEVAMRSRQLGGDLGRFALVCLLEGTDEKTKRPKVDVLRDDVAAVWGAPNPPQVFGVADLREWAGTAAPENLDTLRDWLSK
jgi:hypothetical protein